MKRGLAYSLTGHVVMAMLLLFSYSSHKGSNGPHKEGGNKPQQKSGDIIPKGGDAESKEVEVTLININKRVKRRPLPKAEQECLFGMHYGGIGLQHTMDDIVNKIASGYPADAAGIRIGDKLLNPDEIRGEIGTPVTVIVERNGQVLRFNVVREKICFR